MSMFIITAVFFWLVFSLVMFRTFAHILQVERYHTDAYLKWAAGGGGLRSYCPRHYLLLVHGMVPVFIVFALPKLFLPEEYAYGTLAAIAVFLSLDIDRTRGSFKKPFVVTPRIKRLLAATLIIEAAVLAIGLYLSYHTLVGTSIIIAYLQPLFIAAGNIAVSPVEKFIQEGFKKSAVAKLGAKKVIAITGSYGKTGTKEAIAHLLETSYPLLKTPGSYNTPMGISKIINERLEPHHEIFIVEMGATRRGDIKELCEIAKPGIGVITSTGDAHMETFGTPENVALTKFELADALPPDGILIVNSDYGHSRRLIENRPQKAVTYGLETNADYMPMNIRCSMHGTVFDLKTPDGTVEGIKTRLLGKLNAVNLAGAFAVGRSIGINAAQLKTAAATLPQMEHRLQVIENPGSYLIINDAFNSNPLGAKEAVETLGLFERYKKILVTPGLVDLGGLHEKANFEFGKAAAPHCDLAVLVNERRTAPIKKGLLEGGMNTADIKTFPSLAKAREFIDSQADENSVVLFENDLPDHMELF